MVTGKKRSRKGVTMSRSYRHTPVRGNGGSTEKQDKRIYNRRLRTRVRQMLHVCDDFDGIVLPEVRDVSNPWDMSKDGKHYAERLARFIRTLVKTTRVRDGRRRIGFAITNATVDLAAITNRCWQLRFWMFADNDGYPARWMTSKMAREDASYHVSDFRK
jgi:hypothetical protein